MLLHDEAVQRFEIWILLHAQEASPRRPSPHDSIFRVPLAPPPSALPCLMAPPTRGCLTCAQVDAA